MRRRFAVLLLAGFIMPSAQSAPPSLPPLDRVLPPRAEAIYRAVEPRVDTGAAMAIVTEMAPLWRLAGNPQFDQALESIDATAAGGGYCHALRHNSVDEPGLGDARRRAPTR